MTANRAIWTVLVEECGAEEFDYHWTRCGEFRFMGTLGFGGKVYTNNVGPTWVGCYREDSTPEREDAITSANVRLSKLEKP